MMTCPAEWLTLAVTGILAFVLSCVLIIQLAILHAERKTSALYQQEFDRRMAEADEDERTSGNG